MALSYVQASGNGATTNFAVPFSYLDQTHVHVYISDVETLAFTWVNAGTIQITPAPPSGTNNVEIRRQTPRNVALVDYNNGSVLFDTDLDTANLQSLFIAQEYFEQAENLFPSGHTLDSHTDATPGSSVAKGTMRVYDENSKWNAVTPPTTGGLLIGDTADTKGVRWLAQGTNGYQLEVDTGAAGGLAWKTSLRSLLTTVGDMIYASANNIASRLGIGTSGQVLMVSGGVPAWGTLFTTGDAKLTFKTTADSGWVMMNDGSIGNASSGATTRANADTWSLYELLWNNVSNSWAPVSGGRGATAALDYAANKTLTLPKTLGRALCGAGAGAGLSSRALGETLGSQDAVLIAHNHTLTDPGHSHTERVSDAAYGGSNTSVSRANVDTTGSTASVLATASATTGITLASAGSGTGVGANMQPSTFVNVMIKL
jgi:hypothetical protein